MDFGRDAERLKKVVVQGVLEHEFRWPDKTLIEPATIGDFGVRYEQRAGVGRFVPYPESGQEQAFDLTNAAEVEIGLKTNNGFQPVFSFFPSECCADDHRLHIRLDFGPDGHLKARLRNSQGRTETFAEQRNLPVLDYKRRPWPLGAARLHDTDPARLLGANDEDRLS